MSACLSSITAFDPVRVTSSPASKDSPLVDMNEAGPTCATVVPSSLSRIRCTPAAPPRPLSAVTSRTVAVMVETVAGS